VLIQISLFSLLLYIFQTTTPIKQTHFRGTDL
jgi:hypothetical protein